MQIKVIPMLNDQSGASERWTELLLAGLIWAMLTTALLVLLGFVMPLLLAYNLSLRLGNSSAPFVFGASLALACAAVGVMVLDTRRRYGQRKAIRTALSIGTLIAALLVGPALLLLMGSIIWW